MNSHCQNLYQQLGLDTALFKQGDLSVYSPIDHSLMAQLASTDSCTEQIAQAQQSFASWRQIPAPRRGELIRQFGLVLREHKQTLGELVSWECGKLLQEGLGEVQEMIDICDFAVGLSRQLYGLTISSERPLHKMLETWHPLGPVAIISAFNFPVAVWAWNATLALVCGNSIIWKPSEKTPICALACQSLLNQVCEQFTDAPQHLSQVVIGDKQLALQLAQAKQIALVSATGSCAMGQQIAPIVAARFGRSLLELGGNNALIVGASADLDLALQATLFGAVGTAGQRCTSTRRLFLQRDISKTFIRALKNAYEQVSIGNPLEPSSLVGPLIDQSAFTQMQQALAQAREIGAQVCGGERVLQTSYPDAYYVKPALVIMPAQLKNNAMETFAPILYVFEFEQISQAIAANNDVPQGLSSALFTNDLKEAELFTSSEGSDCGISNINIGTSGAEIGGAFGGEKATGGGRESGSDAWKAYMRRATNTTNYSSDLPLAQGIRFELSAD